MFSLYTKKIITISSRFTRNQGYIDIESSKKIQRQKAIQLLNSFTPQGASPKVSLRIGAWEDRIGIGYYYMEDQENARITTYLLKTKEINPDPMGLPLFKDNIKDLAFGRYEKLLKIHGTPALDLIDHFDVDQSSMIIYSLLAGDNIIIIHPLYDQRVKFIQSLINLVPNLVFSYNRITTACSELDGNENIIGVEVLPKKYRSYKKLYMPLDTIFVDLEDEKVLGEGVKSNHFTHLVSKDYEKSPDLARRQIIKYFTEISKEGFNDHANFGTNSERLTNKIRSKLGLQQKQEQDWMMTF